MPTLEDALILAAEVHRGQTDKRGQPYIFHILRVVLRMDTEEGRIVAALHDVLEDTATTLEQLRDAGYPLYVLLSLERLTRHVTDGEKAPYRDYIVRCSENPLALAVKIADLRDHLDNAEGVLDESHRKRYRQALNYLLEVEEK